MVSVHATVRTLTPSTPNLPLASPGAQRVTMGSWRGSAAHCGLAALGTLLWAAWGTHGTWRRWPACLLPGP